MAFRISKRLRAIADMVTAGSRVCDVGCDHAYIPVLLVESGRCPKALAFDVREGPLLRARAHIEAAGLNDRIETRLSDGLSALSAGEADTLILAGMGGRLTLRILRAGAETFAELAEAAEPMGRHTELAKAAKSAGKHTELAEAAEPVEKCPKTAEAAMSAEDSWERTGNDRTGGIRELILQPQSELAAVRAAFRRRGLLPVREDIVFEDGKYYFPMKYDLTMSPEAEDVYGEKGAVNARETACIRGSLDTPAISDTELTAGDRYGYALLREKHPLLKAYLEKQRALYASLAGKKPDAKERLLEITELLRGFT